MHTIGHNSTWFSWTSVAYTPAVCLADLRVLTIWETGFNIAGAHHAKDGGHALRLHRALIESASTAVSCERSAAC